MGDRFCIVLAGSLAAALLGCSSEPGPVRVPLHGAIYVQGVRVEEGSLTLLPLPGHSAPAATTPIVAGSYAFTHATGPVPGPHRAVVGISRSADSAPGADASAAAGGSPDDAAIKTAPQSGRGPAAAAGPAAASQWELTLEVPANGDYRADLEFGTK